MNAAVTPPSRPSGRRSLVPLVLIALAVAFAFQGTRGLYETTEGRYAEVAREMVRTGDWMTPRLDGQPHWSKPPLAYWTIGLGVRELGANAWGARLPNAVFFVVTVLAVFAIGRSMWDRDTGLLAALVTATAPFMVVGGNSVSTDMLLSLWEILAVLCFWRAMRRVERGDSHRLAVDGMWVSFGLAFLTKGPPGLLPLVAILAFVAVRRVRGQATPRLLRAEGIAAFLVVGFSWYVAIVVRDPSLASYLIGQEVWGRIATPMHHRNSDWFMPLVIYGLPLTVGFGFWCAEAGPLAARTMRALSSRRNARAATHSPPGLFLILWLAIPLVVLSVSRSRLPLYVLPLVPALALALARAAILARGETAALRRGVRIAVASAVVCVGLKGAAAEIPSPKNMGQLRAAIGPVGMNGVVLVDGEELYGLQFYLNGRMERIPEADLRARLNRIARGPSGQTVFVTHREGPVGLTAACESDTYLCHVDDASSPHFTIWRVVRTGE